jgi:hypothetical protein
MSHAPRRASSLLVAIACLGGVACQLRRPNTAPSRTIEPELVDPPLAYPEKQIPKASNAARIRLLDAEVQGNVGRRVLHKQADGELVEDTVWRWSCPPERYLDTALRLEVAASPNMRLVDSGQAPALAATLLVWELESTGGSHLTGTVEFQITWTNRLVDTKLVRESEPVTAELPGDLATAAGRLMRRLASKGLALVASEQ